MTPSTREDFLWLMSDQAAPLLAKVQAAFENRINAVRIAKTLRKSTTPERSALVMEQAQLRIRARKKFSQADSMFFTRRGLEQSSGGQMGKYKALRFRGLSNVADICCGVGGDLIGLAKRKLLKETDRTVGLDLDELTCFFARKNIEVSGLDPDLVTVEHGDFAGFDLQCMDGVHVDPDRRMQDRTVQGNRFSPTLKSIFERISRDCSLSIKVAPATPRASYFPEDMQREWIGDHRECKQQVLWSGPRTDRPGQRTATYLGRDGKISQISVDESEMNPTIEVVDSIGRCIYEPHPTVLAADLTDHIAMKYELRRFTASIVYLTGDVVVDDPLLTRFEVLHILPLSLRQVGKFLNSIDVGRIEVKKRGIENVTAERFGRLKLSGPSLATVILTRVGRKRIAIIAKRPDNPLQLSPSE